MIQIKNKFTQKSHTLLTGIIRYPTVNATSDPKVSDIGFSIFLLPHTMDSGAICGQERSSFRNL